MAHGGCIGRGGESVDIGGESGGESFDGGGESGCVARGGECVDSVWLVGSICDDDATRGIRACFLGRGGSWAQRGGSCMSTSALGLNVELRGGGWFKSCASFADFRRGGSCAACAQLRGGSASFAEWCLRGRREVPPSFRAPHGTIGCASPASFAHPRTATRVRGRSSALLMIAVGDSAEHVQLPSGPTGG